MSEISHQPCPFIDCGSSNAFCYNTELNVGNCFSCHEGYPSRKATYDWADETYPKKEKEKEMHTLETTKTIPTVGNGRYEDMRSIKASVMEDYGVMTFDTTQEYKYPSGGVKVRTLNTKGFYAKDGFKGDELFGMNLFTAGSSKMLTITEGELDALSVAQMLKSGTYINPVVSLPSASPSKKLWENCRDWVDSFEKIIISVDGDDAGDAIANKISKLFPNKTYRVPHGRFKDANEFLQAGAAGEFKSAWWNAKKYVPDNVLNTPDQFLKLFRDTPDHQFVPTGIQALDDKILGLMQGHFTVIKAPTGIGKTEVMRLLEYNLIQQDVPFASWHLEETKLRSLLGLVSYKLNMNVTRRDLIDEMAATEQVEVAITELTANENIYQFFLVDGQGTEELCDQIRYFREACGCRYVFFEPIQDVVSGRNETSKEEMLADLSVRLSKLAAELNVGIITIAHTNDDGDPKYCKMIGQRASVIIDLSRDKESEDEVERNTTLLRVEKNRPCSEEGYAGSLRFNTDTFTLQELDYG
tara:strand:+ start:6174 stop:7754 length:1581 start_codon:yes stop_codon:yes gene_type:complete